MKPSFPPAEVRPASFFDFIRSVLKKRIFLLFLFAAGITFALQFTPLRITLPSVLYVGWVFIGFVWAAYQAQREVMLAYLKAITPAPSKKNRRSGLVITFVPGNEYAYSIADPYAGQDMHISRMQNTPGMECRFDGRGRFFINGQIYYMMAKGGLELNFQILNTGDTPLEITAIHLYDDLNLNHIRIYNDGVFLQGGKVRLPLQLGKRELLTLQARQTISLAFGSNDGLFAADFRALPRYIAHEVVVEVTDSQGERQIYTGDIKTPAGALKNAYVKQWREYEQKEYLFLAGEKAALEEG